jgi:hypothetical protein
VGDWSIFVKIDVMFLCTKQQEMGHILISLKLIILMTNEALKLMYSK